MAEAAGGAESVEYDVVVVGAGVMGSAAAYHCAKRGAKVALVEQFELMHRRGSSHGESRIIRRTYPTDFYTTLMAAAFTAWEEVEADLGGVHLVHKTGGLDLFPCDSPSGRGVLRACEAGGIPTRVIDQAAVRAEFGVTVPSTYIGVTQRDTGVLNATRCCAALQSLAVRYGVTVFERSALRSVTDAATGGRIRVPGAEDDEDEDDEEEDGGVGGKRDAGPPRTSSPPPPSSADSSSPPPAASPSSSPSFLELRFEVSFPAEAGREEGATWGPACTPLQPSTFTRVLRTRKLVFAPGAWAGNAFARQFGLRLNLRVLKCTVHYCRALDHPRAQEQLARLPVVIDYGAYEMGDTIAWEADASAAATDPSERVLTYLCYSLPCRELPGMMKLAIHDGQHIDIEDRTFDIDPLHFSDRVEPWLRARFPFLEPRPVLSETCLYTMTPDEDFIVDHLPGDSRVVLAAGFSGHGFKFGAVIGQMLSDLALDGTLRASLDGKPFRLSREARPRLFR